MNFSSVNDMQVINYENDPQSILLQHPSKAIPQTLCLYGLVIQPPSAVTARCILWPTCSRPAQRNAFIWNIIHLLSARTEWISSCDFVIVLNVQELPKILNLKTTKLVFVVFKSASRRNCVSQLYTWYDRSFYPS